MILERRILKPNSSTYWLNPTALFVHNSSFCWHVMSFLRCKRPLYIIDIKVITHTRARTHAYAILKIWAWVCTQEQSFYCLVQFWSVGQSFLSFYSLSHNSAISFSRMYELKLTRSRLTFKCAWFFFFNQYGIVKATRDNLSVLPSNTRISVCRIVHIVWRFITIHLMKSSALRCQADIANDQHSCSGSTFFMKTTLTQHRVGDPLTAELRAWHRVYDKKKFLECSLTRCLQLRKLREVLTSAWQRT